MVPSARALPRTPHVAVQVSIGLGTELVRVFGTEGAPSFRVYGRMNWAMTLRYSRHRRPLYRFSDRVTSDIHLFQAIDRTSDLFKNTLERALARFIEDITEKDVVGRLEALLGPRPQVPTIAP